MNNEELQALQSNCELFDATYLGCIRSYWINESKREVIDEKYKALVDKVIEVIEQPEFVVKQIAYFLTPVEIQKAAFGQAKMACGGADPYEIIRQLKKEQEEAGNDMQSKIQKPDTAG